MTTSNAKLITVHKEGEEGTITIDSLTGIVKPHEGQEAPLWADGLTCALLQERVAYYFGNDKQAPRLDRQRFEQQIMGVDTISFEDLGWVAVDPEGATVELEADGDHRMQVIADLLGIDRSAEPTEAYEIEVANDTTRLETSNDQAIDLLGDLFPSASNSEKQAATGG
jgi:hypothetical protein